MVDRCLCFHPNKAILADISNKNLSITNNNANTNINTNTKFDIVICLWNVLGHIENENKRIIAFKNIKNITQNNGLLFFDVSNRYNAKHYGIRCVFKNIINNCFLKRKENNIKYFIKITDNLSVKTKSHFFSLKEIKKILKKVGFKIVKIYFIDYKNGKCHLWNQFRGQIFVIAKNKL